MLRLVIPLALALVPISAPAQPSAPAPARQLFLFLFSANDFRRLPKALITNVSGAKKGAFGRDTSWLRRGWEYHFGRRGGCLGIRGKRHY